MQLYSNMFILKFFNLNQFLQRTALICIISVKDHCHYFDSRFINARRRIVQPMIEKSARMGKPPMIGGYKSRKRKPDEMLPLHSPPVSHYPFIYQQDQHFTSFHSGYYQDDALPQNYYSPRPYFPYVDPAVGPSTQASGIPRCQVLPYTHRPHSVSSPLHASNYHATVLPGTSYAHHAYHVGHQSVLPHTSQPGLGSHTQISETVFDPHYQ